ncbi:nuclear transport factor 2 family protein [Pseudokordiimonas caeni]|uniref:nuclear transport factor 2 family protein n=1 Tax=Pseudokordiimonas caeni TaxID=2997908 RepID=UPI0028115752|nr:nuclear transport factor 2 family protein [Pseudokordiimonas caeni]
MISRRLKGIVVGVCFVSISAAAFADEGTSADREAVLKLEESIALVLANDGFEPYAALFHPDYTNWINQDVLMTREDYLNAVRGWYDAGNKAVSTHLVPISLDIHGDIAISRSRLREDFNDGTAFVGRFVTVSKKTDGVWLLYRTSFTTDYRGPAADAPTP